MPSRSASFLDDNLSSHHDHESPPETVLGDFNGQTVLSDGLAYTVSRTNDTFWARMPDPDLVMQAVQGKKGAI